LQGAAEGVVVPLDFHELGPSPPML